MLPLLSRLEATSRPLATDTTVYEGASVPERGHKSESMGANREVTQTETEA